MRGLGKNPSAVIPKDALPVRGPPVFTPEPVLFSNRHAHQLVGVTVRLGLSGKLLDERGHHIFSVGRYEGNLPLRSQIGNSGNVGRQSGTLYSFLPLH